MTLQETEDPVSADCSQRLNWTLTLCSGSGLFLVAHVQSDILAVLNLWSTLLEYLYTTSLTFLTPSVESGAAKKPGTARFILGLHKPASDVCCHSWKLVECRFGLETWNHFSTSKKTFNINLFSYFSFSLQSFHQNHWRSVYRTFSFVMVFPVFWPCPVRLHYVFIIFSYE